MKNMVKLNKHMTDKKGFTLIEVIVSLVLLGILVVIAGMGLVQIVNGYVLAKQNSETIQKVQVAMARIGKELGAATTITSPPVLTSITYTRPTSLIDPTLVTNTIALSGSTVQINGITLINKVTDFSLQYCNNVQPDPCPSSSSCTTPCSDIRRVNISLTITGVGNPFINSFAIVESYL